MENDSLHQWRLATLQDAAEALSALIETLERHPEEAGELFSSDLANVYAKLNYAYNTSETGPEALEIARDDDLVAWPSCMPFKRPSRRAAPIRRPS